MLMMSLMLFTILMGADQNAWLDACRPRLEAVWTKGVIVQAAMFLRDPGHPFNRRDNVATVEFVVHPDGRVGRVLLVGSNGITAFDTTVLEAARDIKRLPPPPDSAISDDGLTHLFWTFARGKPYLRKPSVRLVRFPPQKAIPLFVSEGALSKAMERLLETGTAAINPFISAIKSFHGAALARSAKMVSGGVDAYLMLGGRPNILGSLLVDRLTSMKPTVLREFLERHPAPRVACNILALPLDMPRRLIVEEALLASTRGPVPCPGRSYWKNRSKENDFTTDYTAVAAMFRLTGDQKWKDMIKKAFSNSATRRLAIRAMGLTRSKAFEARLIGLFFGPKKASVSLRVEGLDALARVGTKRCKVIIIANARKKIEALRTRALRLLVHMEGLQTARGYAFLGALRQDPLYENKLVAAHGLAVVAFPQFVNELKGLLRVKSPEAVAQTLSGLDPHNPKAREMLMKFVSDKRPKVRKAALRQLFLVRNDPAVSALFASLKGADKEERLMMLAASSDSAQTAGVLDSDDPAEVVAAASSLNKSQAGRAIILRRTRAWLKRASASDYARVLLVALGIGLR